MLLSPTAFLAGAATWTLAEYALHRFSGHAQQRRTEKGRGLVAQDFGSEHLAHHADTGYFTPTRRKIAAAAISVPAIGAVGSLLVGPWRGVSFALGFGAMYATYEIIHRRTHTHFPRGAYGRWARKHHMHHHFKSPRMNHGVTTPFWDWAFGTLEHTDAPIKVPARHVQRWMVDEHGQLRPELACDYELPNARAGTRRTNPRASSARVELGSRQEDGGEPPSTPRTSEEPSRESSPRDREPLDVSEEAPRAVED